MRRALGSALAKRGLSERAAPVNGSTLMRVPFKTAGPLTLRRLCDLVLPPSAVGGVCTPPMPTGGSPNGFSGVPSLAVIGKGKAGPIPCRRVQRPVGAKHDGVHRVAGKLLSPPFDQDRFGSGRDIAAGGGLQPRQPSTHDTSVCGGAWRCWARIGGERRAFPTVALGNYWGLCHRCIRRRQRAPWESWGAVRVPSAPGPKNYAHSSASHETPWAWWRRDWRRP